MTKNKFRFLLILAATFVFSSRQEAVAVEKSSANEDLRIVRLLDSGWKFLNAEAEGEKPGLNTNGWQTVDVPHDWAINGPFDENNDMQLVQGTRRWRTGGQKAFGSDRRITACRHRLVPEFVGYPRFMEREKDFR